MIRARAPRTRDGRGPGRRLGRELGLALVAGLLLAVASDASGASGAHAKTFADVVPDIPTARSSPRSLVPRRSPLAHIASLPYQGGPVLRTNRTHVIFWQPAGANLAYPPGYQALVEQFLSHVAADSRKPTNVYSLSGQYADSTGAAAYASSYGGAVVTTDPLPRQVCSEPLLTGPGWNLCVNDAQIETEIAHVIGVDQLPSTAQDIYFLVMPEGLGACEFNGPQNCALGGATSGSFCGYHSATADGSIIYAVVPFNGVSGHCQSDNPRPNSSTADPTISTLSHEHIEMITDPLGDAWIDGAGNEAADLCISQYGPDVGGSGAGAWNQVIHGGHYYLQSEWSNWDLGCAPRTRPDTVSFAGPGHPRAGQAISLTAHARPAHGSIAAYNWFFGDRGTGRHKSVAHTYKRGGSYRVVLRTTDSAGLWAYFARTIKVAKPSGSAKRRR